MIKHANIFITGGCGTFGKALAKLRKEEGWTGELTVYSTDTHKHEKMHREYPDIHFVQGDIRNPETLYMAMVGHDVVIHAAAVKVIPTSELYSIDTFDVNVNGSLCVCATAVRAQVKHVLGISTDKACHAANAYGASKYLMEKMFQEYARMESETIFHLVRLGNVLESNGSVIEAWKNSVARGEPIKMTDPEMTRFWLSPTQAVKYAIKAFEFASGQIWIPRLSALSIGKLAEYTVEYTGSYSISERPIEKIPLRPGEKMHETLLTVEEGWNAREYSPGFLLDPTTEGRYITPVPPYTSDTAPELTREELMKLLAEG